MGTDMLGVMYHAGFGGRKPEPTGYILTLGLGLSEDGPRRVGWYVTVNVSSVWSRTYGAQVNQTLGGFECRVHVTKPL